MVVTEDMITAALRAWFEPDDPAIAWLADARRRYMRTALEAAFSAHTTAAEAQVAAAREGLTFIQLLAEVRSRDISRVAAVVHRGALETIADRARQTLRSLLPDGEGEEGASSRGTTTSEPRQTANDQEED